MRAPKNATGTLVLRLNLSWRLVYVAARCYIELQISHTEWLLWVRPMGTYRLLDPELSPLHTSPHFICMDIPVSVGKGIIATLNSTSWEDRESERLGNYSHTAAEVSQE